MSRSANWGALPGKAELERLFLSGMSYGQIGERYGVRPTTVLGTMKRRAKRDGTPWPLKRDNHLWQQRGNLHDPRWDSVTTIMLRAELRELRGRYGVPVLEVARTAGVGQRTIYEICSGKRQKVSRATAEKIMTAVERLERRRKHSEFMRQHHAARRAAA